jgi:predicted amidohydrolase YtcJ
MKKVILNAKVYVERNVFAEAVCIEDGVIRAVGGNEEMRAAGGPGAALIDGQGLPLLPGFFDSHLHLSAAGRREQMIDAWGVSSIEALIQRGREKLAQLKPPPGAVLTGGGFNQEEFTGGKRYPNRYDLDQISRDHAILISRVCGHVVVGNSRALEMAGVADSAPHIAGGQVDLDGAGKPTGVFRENAAALLRDIIPPPSEAELRRDLRCAMDRALSYGVTSAASNDADGPDTEEVIRAFRRIYDEGKSPLRVTMQCAISGEERYLDEYIQAGYTTGRFFYEPYLKMGPLKLFSDGSLGSHTAWLRQPYRDNPSTTGLVVLGKEELTALVTKASARGLQAAVHAIGDAAVEAVISAYEKVTGPGHNPLRHGVLHCQITDPELLARMGKNDLLALVQPIFVLHDLYMVESRVGRELASTSYAWASMEKGGIRAAYGTDCPVESMDPIQGIACAVTRKDPAADFPREGFFPAEGVDVYTAVDNYTRGSAYANFDEGRLGRIRPGTLADLVLLDRDIFSLPPEDLHRARVTATMVGGEWVYGGL